MSPTPRKSRIFLRLGILLALVASFACGAEPAPIDFNKDIRPLIDATCVSCHGPDKAKGDLRLDAGPLALRGGVTGKLFEPGKGADSYLVRRLKGLGDEDRMPLKKDPFTDEQIAKVIAWIDQGANWPLTDADAKAEVKKHWSFVKPVRPAEPKVSDERWPTNAIDRFILARLDREGLKPSSMASKETLLRRVHLDLIGLPPSPEEIDAFLADTSPDAYQKVVEKLLASKYYGERWGRHWLDQARYADSNGYSIDAPRSIWPYRDWVIDAINDDMPFDRFMTEQLAGDLLPDATMRKVATGFHRNTQINEEGGIDPEQFRVESVIDRVGTTGTVFLGLTIACAQCHNHKFDPISQKEYYQLFSFFNNCDEPKLKLGELPNADEVRARIAEIEAAGSTGNSGARRDLPVLRRQLNEGATTLVLSERKEPRKSHLLVKGDFTRPAEEVTPGVPRVLHPFASTSTDGQAATTNNTPQTTNTPNRLDLAAWLSSPENPLTARVAVNRIWQQYFGRGLVETENDFGSQGSLPSHPDLLDYLATEFVKNGWSMKSMHRLIVTSSTYRQSSTTNDKQHASNISLDPLNRLLWRQTRIRIESEIVRDVALVASGLLSDNIGGPGVYPPQPEGVLSLGQVKRVWKESTGPDRYRRGMYTFLWRMTPHPLLGVFDAPEATSTCTRRMRSNTPLQSLMLLNDKAFVEFAQALAGRVLKAGLPNDRERIILMFRLCTGRAPSDDELKLLSTVIDKDKSTMTPADAEPIIKGSAVEWNDPVEHAAWTLLARVVLNLDETITRE